MNTFILALLVGLVVTAISTAICIPILNKLKIVDDPKRHKHPAILHTKPIPRGGGIPIYLGILAAGLVFIPLSPPIIALYIASFLALAIGVLDDILDISPYIRFGVNFLTAGIVVGSGINIPFITNPLGGILNLETIQFGFPFMGMDIIISFANILAVLWLVWVMNMLNWSKGVDGQMPGIVAIAAICIGILSLRFPLSDQTTFTAATLSFIIAGASLGFLVFNFYPAKIFPGYGATALYLLLGAVSIMSSVKLATAILVLGVPMIDGIVTILRRIMTGHSPFWHDKKHLHHLLLEMGLGKRRIALFYWSISAILGAISLTLDSRGKLFAIIMLLVLVGGPLLFLHFALRANTKLK